MTKLFVVQLSSASCYLLPLKSKYVPLLRVLQCPRPEFIHQTEIKFLTNKEQQLILFLSFRRVVNVIYSFLGNSPASEI